jgi:hypothetical protein
MQVADSRMMASVGFFLLHLGQHLPALPVRVSVVLYANSPNGAEKSLLIWLMCRQAAR